MVHNNDELDTLIENVGRQMTEGDPGAAFTSSVLARVASDAPRVSSWRPAFAGLAAAAVLLVAATLVYRGRSSTPPPVQPKPDTTSASDVSLKPDAATQDRGPERPARRARAQADPNPALQITQVPSDIEALTVPSIAVERLAPLSLSPVDALEDDPLTIAPLTVPPIDGADDTPRRFE